MTKAAANKALTSLLVLGLVATAGDAFAKPGHTKKQAKQAPAKRVKVAKAKADAASVVASVVAKTNSSVSNTKTVPQPPSPDALLARLSTDVKSAPKAGSVDALVAKACALGDKPVAKKAHGVKSGKAKLAYMRKLTSRAKTLGFAPIMREGTQPKGDNLVVRMKDLPLASKVVRKVVRAHRRDVTACHEASAVRGRAPRGNVTLRFAVAASGKVTTVEVVAAGIGHGAFERCLEGRIRGWQFPKGDTVTKVSFPYTLQ